MRVIESSELIINNDGSIFHLHLKPEQLADKVILVGDPGRVEVVASFFEKTEASASNREFKTITGYYKGKRISVVSTGIGTDNIDIVVNELDALSNIDLKTRTEKSEHKKLTIVRLGTSGALQPEIDLGSYVLTETSIGFDGLLNFYANRNKVSNLEMEAAFIEHTKWNPQCAKPYFCHSASNLVELFSDFTTKGITISAPGFYGPQGRVLRLPLADPKLNEKIESFNYNGRKITNFEMESSAINGLSHLLGHDSVTICTIIANRVAKDAKVDYQAAIKNLIENTLNKLATL
ncbi:MAG: nucleoside phosphorylase [Bacteroidales bacterium]|nr:nucleoside phosphorylase [Bacteroidales bacterium]HPD95273.1 nucleoside phosphorylase [Tenuifilaceae bacterium]HRX30581.1 nucleoside phosphorylase [Tenuifilaceae bacterium]